MNEDERKKLKDVLFELIAERRKSGGSVEHDPDGDKAVLEAARLRVSMG